MNDLIVPTECSVCHKKFELSKDSIFIRRSVAEHNIPLALSIMSCTKGYFVLCDECSAKYGKEQSPEPPKVRMQNE